MRIRVRARVRVVRVVRAVRVVRLSPCRRSRASSRHGKTTYSLLTMAHHAVGAGRRLGMVRLLTIYYPLSLTMPSEPGVVFSTTTTTSSY